MMKKVIFLLLCIYNFCNALPLEIKNGHFYRGEEQVKLWGVHISPGTGLTHESADVLIPRLKKMGFNAVCIWGTREIFKDGVNPSSMDGMDYLIAKCKKEGLYVWLAAFSRMPEVKVEDFCEAPLETEEAKKWWEAVKWSMEDSQRRKYFPLVSYIDKNIQAVRIKFITDLLNHKNPYTGKKYKDEENLLLYLADETSFALQVAWGVPGKFWHPYFQEKLKQEIEKQGGGIEAILKITEQWHNILVNRIKMIAPKRLMNTDAVGYARLWAMYGVLQGDFYATGCRWETSDDSLLTSPPSFLGSRDGHSMEFKIKGKPWVIYTGNQPPPSEHRAEFPLRVVAFTSHNDCDGVFFYHWVGGYSDEVYLKMPLFEMKSRGAWDISSDEILLSQMKIAGIIFLNGYIPSALAPVTFTFGKKAMVAPYGSYGSSWWNTDSYRKYRQTAYTTGAQLEIDMKKDIEYEISGAIESEMKCPLIWGNEERKVIWDWDKGILVIDTPEAKTVTGFLKGGYKFSGGIEIKNINREFVSIGIVSEDKRPIMESKKIIISAVSKSYNTGFQRDKEGKIVNEGTVPVIVERVSGEIVFPATMDFTCKKFDFALKEIGEVQVKNHLELKEEEPVFYYELRR